MIALWVGIGRIQVIQDYFAMHNVKCEGVDVVAHSMGGLVTRAAIHQMTENGQDDFIGLYVTFASPLGGHSAVEWGLKFMPEPVPAWIEVTSGVAL